MHAFDVLGDPVRRRILELLADDQRAAPAGTSAGSISAVIESEFGISQPAVSRHLRVLREHGFARSVVDGQRRLYAIDASGLAEADEWLNRYRGFWAQRLDALETELHRGRRGRRSTEGALRS
jgi:DNA-binding transcriptional ArsR family regulator